MNENECANCVVHGWTQPDSETSLRTCKNCKFIKYCSNECQDEHWTKVHKHHCQYFADPAKNEASQHKETDCSICIKAAQVGEAIQANLKEADNPNYECIFKMEILQSLIHPHPFPVTGQEGDIFEKGIIVLWQLVRKFQIIHPDIAHNYQQEFLELENAFIEKRVEIWEARKIYPHPEAQGMDTERIRQNLPVLFDDIHRCSHCKTTMYCSRDCQVRDYYQVHEKACKKDKEGRKKKMAGSDRRKAGREQIERFETENVHPIFLEVLESFKLKHAIIKQE